MAEESDLQNPSFDNLGIPNLTEAIEKLKAHPEIISMAASVLGQASEGAHTAAGEDSAPSEPDASASGGMPAFDGATLLERLPDLLNLLSPMLKGKGGTERNGHPNKLGKSAALLCALKPYLSSSRCETVDKLVELQRLGELFEKLT